MGFAQKRNYWRSSCGWMTREIIAAGTLLDIDVLDHLVIGQGRFVSMRERGLGFAR